MPLRHSRAAGACLLLLTTAVLLLILLPHPPTSPVDDPASAHRATTSVRVLPVPGQTPGHPPDRYAGLQSSPDGSPSEPFTLTHRGGTHSVTASGRAPLGTAAPFSAVAAPAQHDARTAGTRRPGPAALRPAVLQTFRC